MARAQTNQLNVAVRCYPTNAPILKSCARQQTCAAFIQRQVAQEHFTDGGGVVVCGVEEAVGVVWRRVEAAATEPVTGHGRVEIGHAELSAVNPRQPRACGQQE